jgi:hypothetical protein
MWMSLSYQHTLVSIRYESFNLNFHANENLIFYICQTRNISIIHFDVKH